MWEGLVSPIVYLCQCKYSTATSVYIVCDPAYTGQLYQIMDCDIQYMTYHGSHFLFSLLSVFNHFIYLGPWGKTPVLEEAEWYELYTVAQLSKQCFGMPIHKAKVASREPRDSSWCRKVSWWNSTGRVAQKLVDVGDRVGGVVRLIESLAALQSGGTGWSLGETSTSPIETSQVISSFIM